MSEVRRVERLIEIGFTYAFIDRDGRIISKHKTLLAANRAADKAIAGQHVVSLVAYLAELRQGNRRTG